MQWRHHCAELFAVVDNSKAHSLKLVLRDDVLHQSRRQRHTHEYHNTLDTACHGHKSNLFDSRQEQRLAISHGELVAAGNWVNQQCLVIYEMSTCVAVENSVASIVVICITFCDSRFALALLAALDVGRSPFCLPPDQCEDRAATVVPFIDLLLLFLPFERHSTRTCPSFP